MERPSRHKHQRNFSQIKPHNIDLSSENSYMSVQKIKHVNYGSKISIKIKMPKIRLDNSNFQIRLASESPVKRFVKVIQPRSLNDEVDIVYQTTSKRIFNDKLVPRQSPPVIKLKEKRLKKLEKLTKNTNTSENLPKVNKFPPLTKKLIDDNNIYFELLGFFIKKHLDYNPLYKRIDTECKGYFDKHDLVNFLYISSANCDIEETVERIFSLAQGICPDNDIKKRTFFAMCSSIEYDTLEDYKLIIGDNLLKLIDRVGQLKKVFREFTKGICISRKAVVSMCSRLLDRPTMRAIDLVASEQIDFPRFLTCLPFFMWLRCSTDSLLESL